ncbi:PH domain-containing protein [Halogeometricum luteum]|uniref:PH domain-containing protein n=1 Tax=Halogeometricum luteum TaxID=2950537 RepID=A0ABU2FYT3_9EURY|nr:PH domain-containing protein [Halogeometricum sp. S3BR5-2]MDS0293239.1 PH domain-containing protein [Halogeometricum sp. S3BR5-2]
MNRLDPRVQLLWVASAAVSALVVGGVLFAVVAFLSPPFLPSWTPYAAAALVFLLGAATAVARYRSWGYEVREDSLYLERGVFTRVRTVVPFVRIQHVDSSRGPIERVVGLASTVVYTAGSRGADVSVPGLTADGADELRERLKRLAIRSEGDDAV